MVIRVVVEAQIILSRSGADVVFWFLDNEVYSNTGGHLSKGTPYICDSKISAA